MDETELKHYVNIDKRTAALLEFIRLQQAVLDFLKEHPEVSGAWPFRDGFDDEPSTQP